MKVDYSKTLNEQHEAISYYEKKYNDLVRENKELKEQLKGTTHCFDEEEHKRLKKENEELKTKFDIADTNYDIIYGYFMQVNELLDTELCEEVLEEIIKLKRNNNALKEFEKWLVKNYYLDVPDIANNSPIKEVYDKLQDLKKVK